MDMLTVQSSVDSDTFKYMYSLKGVRYFPTILFASRSIKYVAAIHSNIFELVH